MNDKNELTPDEEQELSALIKASYPSPKSGMADRVRDKISAVRAARKTRSRLFIRYGSIAACVVIIAGISLTVLPRLSSGKAVFDSKDECCAEDIFEEAENGAAPMEIYSLTSDDCDSAAIPEEDGSQNKLCLPSGLAPETYPVSNGTEYALENCAEECPEKYADIASDTIFALIDIDGDGVSEECTVASVTEPEFALIITASAGGEIKYETVFPLSPCSFSFEKTDGQMLIREKDNATGKVTYYEIVADGNEIMLKQIV